MSRIPVALLLLVSFATSACLTSDDGASVPAPVVDTTSTRTISQGTVVGMTGLYGGHTYLGIPYARPPVGELRWRSPRPPAPFGTLQATEHMTPCPQFASPMSGVNDVPAGTLTGAEDCLGLDIYAPAFAADAVPAGGERLPVMFWIHGGGNTIGTNHFYDGSRLASEQRVIVVAVNYRLGVLGWLRNAKLHEGLDPIETSGNFGTLDLVRALEWVRANIAPFGGDPGNVTIFGESAGGHNVFTMLASPQAAGLFHRAIVQSGGAWEATPASGENFVDDADPGDPRSSNELLLAYLQHDGRAASRDEAKAVLAAMSGQDVGAYLRGKSVAEVFAILSDESGIGMYDSPRVFADGTVLPKGGIAKGFGTPGGTHPVPVMLGTNRDEQRLFTFFDERYVSRWFEILPFLEDEHAYYRDTDRASRAWKISGVDHPAAEITKHRPGKVFAYRWDWDEEPTILWANLGELIGAAHGFEIPFVFGHFDLGPTGNISFTEENAPGREALSKAMRSYWAAFAYDGDPGRGRDGDLPAWGAWDPDGDRYVVLDTEAGGGIRMSREIESARDLGEETVADPTYGDERARCMALAILADDMQAVFGEDGFKQAGQGRCAGFDMRELLASRWD